MMWGVIVLLIFCCWKMGIISLVYIYQDHRSIKLRSPWFVLTRVILSDCVLSLTFFLRCAFGPEGISCGWYLYCALAWTVTAGGISVLNTVRILAQSNYQLTLLSRLQALSASRLRLLRRCSRPKFVLAIYAALVLVWNIVVALRLWWAGAPLSADGCSIGLVDSILITCQLAILAASFIVLELLFRGKHDVYFIQQDFRMFGRVCLPLTLVTVGLLFTDFDQWAFSPMVFTSLTSFVADCFDVLLPLSRVRSERKAFAAQRRKGGAKGRAARAAIRTYQSTASTSTTRSRSERGVCKAEFMDMLRDTTRRRAFKNFLQHEWSGENLMFIEKLEGYGFPLSVGQMSKIEAQDIYKQFIKPGSTYQVNVGSHTCVATRKDVEGAGEVVDGELFRAAGEEIVALMMRDSYMRFLVHEPEYLAAAEQEPETCADGGSFATFGTTFGSSFGASVPSSRPSGSSGGDSSPVRKSGGSSPVRRAPARGSPVKIKLIATQSGRSCVVHGSPRSNRECSATTSIPSPYSARDPLKALLP